MYVVETDIGGEILATCICTEKDSSPSINMSPRRKYGKHCWVMLSDAKFPDGNVRNDGPSMMELET